MDKLTLYNITDEMALIESAIDKAIDYETGEILNTELLEHLKELQVAYIDKIKGCVYVINKTDNNIDLIDKEIERLKKLKEHLKNKDLRIREYLAENIEIGKKLDLGTHTISWRKSEAIEIDDESVVPNEFKKEKITYTIDKTKIKEFIKNGGSVAGAKLVERNNLQIK